MSDHYKIIVEECKNLVGLLDGDDINCISRVIINLDLPNQYDDLSDDLSDMTNAMWCVYGLDYGSDRDWSFITEDILKQFPEGYISSKENLIKLIKLII